MAASCARLDRSSSSEEQEEDRDDEIVVGGVDKEAEDEEEAIECSRRRLCASMEEVDDDEIEDLADEIDLIDEVAAFLLARSTSHGATTSLTQPINSSSRTTTFQPKKANNSRSI